MLAIRLQRIGRSGHAQFRMVVQDSHLSPKSGKVVVNLGSYNPHTKATTLDKEKATFYLEHGAQPSDRVVSILKSEGVKLPKWVTPAIVKTGKTKKPEKLRQNQPAKPAQVAAEEPSVEVEPEAPTEAEAPAEVVTAPTPDEEQAEVVTADEPTAEAEVAVEVASEEKEAPTVEPEAGQAKA